METVSSVFEDTERYVLVETSVKSKFVKALNNKGWHVVSHSVTEIYNAPYYTAILERD